MVRLLILSLILLNFSLTVFSQNDDSIQVNSIKDYYKEYKLQPRLYIQRVEKRKKIRVKEGALINCQLVNKEYTGLAYLKIITDEGIYIAPLIIKTDSIITRKKKKKRKKKKSEIVVFASDTVVFIQYNDILNFSFRNNIDLQNDMAGLLLFTGGEFVFAPMIITPIIYGSVENVPVDVILGFISSGIPLIIGGIIWKVLLKKFRSYPMQLYDFVLIKKTD